MNELDGDIRRFLTRLTDAAPDAPDAGALVDRSPSPAGRPSARLVGALAVVVLAVGGLLAVQRRNDPSIGDEVVPVGTTTASTVLCAYVPATMPDVVGLPIEEARRMLAAPCGGLEVEVHEVPSSDVSPGVVLTQSLAAGMTGRSVVLEVAVAGASDTACTLQAVRVLPNVVGMTAQGAADVLDDPCLRLTVVTLDAFDQRVPPGVIVDQRPVGGELVSPGAQVTVLVAAERTAERGFHTVGSFTLDDGSRRVVELEPGGICISRGDDATRGCDTLPAALGPVVVFFGGSDDSQEMWGLLDPGLTIRVERDGVAVPLQQTTEPVGGHLAFFGLVPAGGRVTITVVDASGTVVKRLDDVAR